MIYLDLDGVFADFNSELKRVRQAFGGRTLDASLEWAAIERIPNFYANLALLPDSLELFKALAHHGDAVEILTALPRPTGHLATATQDKCAWVAKHLSPTIKVNTIYGGINKHVFAKVGDVLVDDKNSNLGPWREAGGIGVLHKNVKRTLAELAEIGLI